MKKLAVILILAASLAPNSEAGLVSWAKKHRRFLTMEAVAVTAAVVHQTGMRHCRRGDIEKCDEAYGSANAWFWTATANSVVVLPAIAEACWKDQGDSAKFCNAFVYGSSTYQFAQGIKDWRTYAPKQNVNLSKIELVH